MTHNRCQPILETPSPEEFQAWADEAQACVDSGEVIISDHRKAQATIDALRSHASLKGGIELLQQKLEFAEFEWNRATEGMKERDARIKKLEALLRSCRQFVSATTDRPFGTTTTILDEIDAALQPKAGS